MLRTNCRHIFVCMNQREPFYRPANQRTVLIKIHVMRRSAFFKLLAFYYNLTNNSALQQGKMAGGNVPSSPKSINGEVFCSEQPEDNYGGGKVRKKGR